MSPKNLNTQPPAPIIHVFDLGNERPLAFKALINKKIKTLTMLDSGASTSFIDEAFIRKHKLVSRPKQCAEVVRVVDGRQSASGMITHEIDLSLTINEHQEILTFQITCIARYDIILGKSWLSKHDPEIRWSSNLLSFPSSYCQENCIRSPKPSQPSEYLYLPSQPPRVPRSPSCPSTCSFDSFHSSPELPQNLPLPESPQQMSTSHSPISFAPKPTLSIKSPSSKWFSGPSDSSARPLAHPPALLSNLILYLKSITINPVYIRSPISFMSFYPYFQPKRPASCLHDDILIMKSLSSQIKSSH